METLKKDLRYGVWPYHQPEVVNVIVDEAGKVLLFYDEENECWDEPRKDAAFFISEIDAKNHAEHYMIPDKEKDRVRKFLEYFECDVNRMKEVIPEIMVGWMVKGRDRSLYTWKEVNLLYEAIAGRFNINAVTFRIEEVSHIRHFGNCKYRVVLRDGTKVETETSIEAKVIEAAFGKNHSGKIFTK